MSRDPDRLVKCLVWDLDDTLWRGTLLEGDDVQLRDGVLPVLDELDKRGIVHSIVSRNEPGPATDRLCSLGVAGYFLAPQYGWGAKSSAVRRVAGELGLGLDAIAFVDDQAFERDEVLAALPQVRCYHAADIPSLPRRAEFQPGIVSADGRRRRLLYRSEFERRRAEAEWDGVPVEFMRSLNLVLRIWPASSADLERAEELTRRTNQLNSTGVTYDSEQLRAMIGSPRHTVLSASLEDRYGPYGVIGLALIEHEPDAWWLRLLLMSCRVASRGAGGAFFAHIVAEAEAAATPLRADFVHTGVNRQMYLLYRFAGFREIGQEGPVCVLERHSGTPVPTPAWVTVTVA
jgi:FkbH-like protein